MVLCEAGSILILQLTHGYVSSIRDSRAAEMMALTLVEVGKMEATKAVVSW
jgi:hypothetical protein